MRPLHLEKRRGALKSCGPTAVSILLSDLRLESKVCWGGQKVSESSESFSVVPPLKGPRGFLGLRGPWRPGPFPLGRGLSRKPGEGAPELQGEQKGIMEARMRARQSATCLLGAQARAGVRPGGAQRKQGGEAGDRHGSDLSRGRRHPPTTTHTNDCM